LDREKRKLILIFTNDVKDYTLMEKYWREKQNLIFPTLTKKKKIIKEIFTIPLTFAVILTSKTVINNGSDVMILFGLNSERVLSDTQISVTF
jgi:hypothetical protein